MKIIDGKKIAAEIKKEIADKVQERAAKKLSIFLQCFKISFSGSFAFFDNQRQVGSC